MSEFGDGGGCPLQTADAIEAGVAELDPLVCRQDPSALGRPGGEEETEEPGGWPSDQGRDSECACECQQRKRGQHNHKNNSRKTTSTFPGKEK